MIQNAHLGSYPDAAVVVDLLRAIIFFQLQNMLLSKLHINSFGRMINGVVQSVVNNW